LDEQLYYAWVSEKELVEFLEILYQNGSGDCFALLEKVPASYIDERERQNGIKLVNYNEEINVGEWTRGRVFNTDGEIRWERNDDGYKVVYAGTAEEAAEKMNKYEQELVTGKPQPYYLWGDLLEKRDRQELGLENKGAFYLESMIPRIFQYPLAAGNKRLVIKVVSYEDVDTAMPQYFRFHSIEEVRS